MPHEPQLPHEHADTSPLHEQEVFAVQHLLCAEPDAAIEVAPIVKTVAARPSAIILSALRMYIS